jgi:hypothetical protein
MQYYNIQYDTVRKIEKFGYQLEGDSHRCCGADGTWSGENPQCERMLLNFSY